MPHGQDFCILKKALEARFFCGKTKPQAKLIFVYKKMRLNPTGYFVLLKIYILYQQNFVG